MTTTITTTEATAAIQTPRAYALMRQIGEGRAKRVGLYESIADCNAAAGRSEARILYGLTADEAADLPARVYTVLLANWTPVEFAFDPASLPAPARDDAADEAEIHAIESGEL
jgi:hypothetical protein